MIIPRPKKETYSDNHFSMGTNVVCWCDSKDGEYAVKALRIFLPQVSFVYGEKADAQLIVRQNRRLSGKNEYYELNVSENLIEISCTDKLGARNAASSLFQLITANEPERLLPFYVGTFKVQCCNIKDYPDSSYRSAMIDLGREYIPSDRMKSNIIQMALSKMNYIHFHLTEDRGFGITSDLYPELLGPRGMHYTKTEIKMYVEFAEELCLQSIPELEMPAHANPILEKFAQMRCETTDVEPSKWVMCVGREETYEILENLIREIAEIFPGDIFHIGTDELEFRDEPNGSWPTWDNCKHCKAMCEREGIEYNDRQIFYYFVNRIYKIVKSLGKRLMMWNENIDVSVPVTELPKDILIQFWRTASPCRGPQGCSMSLFAEQGFEVVNSYFRETYFDFDDYCILEKLENWVPSSSPEVAKGSEHLIVGGEMCAWGETPAHYSYSLPSGFLIFGDRLWNHEIYKYDEEYYKGVTKAILGPQTPAGFNVFTYLGSAFLPRDNVRKGFPDAVTASIEEIDNAIQILTDIDKKAPFFCIYTARAYKGCLEWIKAEKLNPTPKNDAE